MATPSDSAALLQEAISKVYNIKSCVSTALHLCPDVPDLGPAAVESTLECLERAQQQLQQLQQLEPHIQQIAASVSQQQRQQAAVAVAHPSQWVPGAASSAWVSAAQQQASLAAVALQQHVQAALYASSSTGCGLLRPPRQLQRQHYEYQPLLQVLQFIASVAPNMQLHLFRSSSNQLHCSIPWVHRSVTLEQQLAKYSSWTDEVRVVCAGVFVASIALAAPGSLEPVRVCLDSEDKASSIDAWASSKHQVFKRISNVAVRALVHFQKLQQVHTLLQPPSTVAQDAAAAGASYSSSSSSIPAAGVALTCLLLWLSCYDDLFNRPCDVSGKLLTWEPATAMPLPPVLRPYWLTLEQLTEAVRDRSKRKAYHIHHAPWPPLEQQAAAQQQLQGCVEVSAQQQQPLQRIRRLSSEAADALKHDERPSARATDEQMLEYMQTIMAQ